jgi:hypothetical protein
MATYEIHVSLTRPVTQERVLAMRRATRKTLRAIPLGTKAVRMEYVTERQANDAAAELRKLDYVKSAVVQRVGKHRRDGVDPDAPTVQTKVVRRAQRVLDAAEKTTEVDRRKYAFKPKKYDD